MQPRRTLGALLLFLMAAVLPASGQGSDGRYLPDATWVRVQTVRSARYIPRQFTDCTEIGMLSHPVGRRASSTIAGGGSFFYFGGGGGSNPGNDVETYDAASNTWTQRYQPECVPSCCCNPYPTCNPTNPCSDACRITGGTGTAEITPGQRPYVEHAYQLITYNPLRGRFVAALTSGTWEWDPQTDEWNRLTTERPESNGIETKLLVFDPDAETVLYLATTSFNHTVFQFDYDESRWIARHPIPEQISWAELYGAYDSREHRHLISHGTGTLWLYDARDGSWMQLQDVPPQTRFSSFVSYDPLNGFFVVGKRENDSVVRLSSYQISTNTWSPLVLAGVPPQTPVPGLANNLAYDPVWQRFYYLNVRAVSNFGEGGTVEGDVETWALRLGGPVGPGDIDCDGHVGAADVVGMILLTASEVRPECGAVDVNRDGSIDAADVSGSVQGVFASGVFAAGV